MQDGEYGFISGHLSLLVWCCNNDKELIPSSRNSISQNFGCYRKLDEKTVYMGNLHRKTKKQHRRELGEKKRLGGKSTLENEGATYR